MAAQSAGQYLRVGAHAEQDHDEGAQELCGQFPGHAAHPGTGKNEPALSGWPVPGGPSLGAAVLVCISSPAGAYALLTALGLGRGAVVHTIGTMTFPLVRTCSRCAKASEIWSNGETGSMTISRARSRLGEPGA